MDAPDPSPGELAAVTSSDADYSPFPPMADMQQPNFFYDLDMAQSMFQQQNFNLQYLSIHNLFPIDTIQIRAGTIQQQPYVPLQPSSLPEQSTSALVSSTTSATSTRHDYVPLVRHPSITASFGSAYSDGDGHSTHDEVSEKRRERRRAQNRAAQRAFRARKEETIKESFTRLDALQEELGNLQSNNSNLRAQIAILQRENVQLKRNSTGNLD